MPLLQKQHPVPKKVWLMEVQDNWKTTIPFDPAILHETQKIIFTALPMDNLNELKAGFNY